MTIKTFHGDEYLLEVICEKRLSNEVDDGLIMCLENQGWSGYIAILRGPIYPNIMKTFWLYSSISSDGNRLISSISGITFVIT